MQTGAHVTLSKFVKTCTNICASLTTSVCRAAQLCSVVVTLSTLSEKTHNLFPRSKPDYYCEPLAQRKEALKNKQQEVVTDHAAAR